MARIIDRLHDRTIKAAKGKDNKYELRDGKGLVLRVYPNNEKRWYLIYDFNGRRRNMVLGEYPGVALAQARHLRDDARGLISRGIDPLADRQREQREMNHNPTFAELAAKYLDSRKARNYSARYRTDCKRTYEVYTPARIRKMKVRDIEPRDIASITRKLEDRNKLSAARRALAHLSALFKWAKPEYVSINPCLGLTTEPGEPKEPVVLLPFEIKLLWTSIDSFKTHVSVKNALRIQFLTLTRRAEVCKAEWGHIDWEARIWTLPLANVKNKKPHRLYLTDTVLAILRDQKLIAGKSKWVFPGIMNAHKHLEPDTVTQVVGDNRHQTGIKKDFNTHTLRKTSATESTKSGAPRDFVKRALNHSIGDVTEIYDQYSYDKEKREVLEIWERRLLEIISDKEGNHAGTS